MALERIRKLISIAKEIRGLPRVQISLHCNDASCERVYREFTRPHPRLLLVRNKTLGVALIDTTAFSAPEAYIQSVNGKNSAAYFARKASRAGYAFKPIDPNLLGSEIFEVNTSVKERQGREMDSAYFNRDMNYPAGPGHRYFGVFIEGKLVAYCWLMVLGELVLVNRLLGHGDHLKNGVMYLLMTEAITAAIANREGRYIMYDTYFGASEGLKMFKERLGFRPYRVSWRMK
jgi:hypothetical protein